ncbi:transglycosylase domain-containing protein [Novosphingobium sp.]|uniref:penicillin-binding protein 1A n=1 Tax=Novosphingobium sp. TaxID=1874826 RepID=UPI00286C0B8D|nr:transglycosylase domain-containing protein [Novosphingobium sp.]
MAESDDQEPTSVRLRIRREASGLWSRTKGLASGLWARIRASDFADWYRARWADNRKFRVFNYLLGAFVAFNLLFWVAVTRNLPSADSLLTYQPPLPTMVRGSDGEIVYSYARERRVQLRYVDFPEKLKGAYLSAEDKTFWSHGGVDYSGLIGAVFDYVTKLGSGKRAKGGSTITQQVAKNILIGNEYSVTRKIKEMVVARRIESVLEKEQILELYLNEIPLGRQSFGVQAAAQAYFGKDVAELSLAQDAFLAALPRGPEIYGRANHAAEAVERRNWVLDQMVRNGAASAAEAAAAKAEPLGIIPRRGDNWDPANGYFIEEVRRQLIDRYGENAETGPNSVYAGGLWVRTSLDPQLQKASQDSLRKGLLGFGGRGGNGKPLDHVDLDKDAWQGQIALLNKSINFENWRVGLVIGRTGNAVTVGFADGDKGALTGAPATIAEGDVVAAAPVGTKIWTFRSIPEITGGLLLEDAHSGRVLAMQGGFDAGLGSFNRATQAQRQPGSTIKPFVYGTGLDFGMSPSSEVIDGKFCVYQGSSLGQKCFQNFGGGGSGATHTMRWGLEQSRNLMTVRIANDTGMDNVSRTFERVGIGKYPPYLAFALGAGETTVQQMVNAYAALANNGVQFPATVIDYVQDRTGKVILRADTRRCEKCNMAEWDGKPMPRFNSRGKQVMDPRTAFQVVHMLEGVVTRGTAYALADLGLPLFGKTGTTSGPTNVWFVGGNQDIVGGVYLGYDQPRSLGGWAQGGSVAAPIFKQLVASTRPRWSTRPFTAPAEIHWVKVDRISGKRVFTGTPGDGRDASVIWEAFKAESEARPGIGTEEREKQRAALIAAARRGAGRPKAPAADTSAGPAKEPDAVPAIAPGPAATSE